MRCDKQNCPGRWDHGQAGRVPNKLLITLAGLIVLTALFYAVADWPSKHAWEKYKREQEAKGEIFDLKKFIPPQPPLDQNFATAPVIASCYESMIDTAGHEVRPHRMDVVDRLEMPISADEDRHMPTNGYWAKGTVTDLSAWQRYYRRLAATTNLFPVPPRPRTPAADVLYALAQYDPTLEDVRAASRLPYAQFPLEYNKENPAEIFLPHLARMKGLARLLELRSIAELQSNQSDQALDDALLTLFLTKALRPEPIIISHLVRIAMTEIALQSIYEGLADHRWTDAQLSALDDALAPLDFLADYEYAMQGERIFHTATIEYYRHHRSQDIFTLNTDKAPSTSRKILLHLMPASFYYKAELFLSQMHDQWVFPLVDTAQRIVSPAKVRESEAGMTNSFKHPSFENDLASLLLPSVLASAKRFARAQSSVDLARVAIALERYRLANGQLPDSLGALAPKFIAAVPHDVINGQPLHYQLIGDGQFTLYAVGWNETDDGGVRGTGSESTRIFDTGDLVWSYPAK